jgi:hypothetical protein
MPRELRLSIDDGEITYTIDLDDPSNRHVVTYADARKEFIQDQGADIKDTHRLVNVRDGEDMVVEDESVKIEIEADGTLALVARAETTKISVRIHNGRETYSLEAPPVASLSDLKDLFRQQGHADLVNWSSMGRRLDDDNIPILELGKQQGVDVPVLVGAIMVTVSDISCEKQDAIEMFEYQTVAELREAYLHHTGRVFHKNAQIRLNDELLQDDSVWCSFYHRLLTRFVFSR